MWDMNVEGRVYLTCDVRYVMPLSVVLYSLLKQADPERKLTIYIAHDGSFSEGEGRESIQTLVSRYPFANVVFCNAARMLKTHRTVLESARNKWAPVIWAGPLLTEVLSEEVTGRIVYLDVDMLICRDLGELFDLNLHGNIAAAVPEGDRTRFTDLADCGWPENATTYYNNGTMVIDLDAYRREHVAERIVEWCRKYKDVAIRADQDAQNVVFGARTMPIHPKWNYNDGWLARLARTSPFGGRFRGHRRREILEAVLSPGIIHYISRKPWTFTHRPERGVYHQHLRELGCFDPSLEGHGFYEKMELAFYDIYNGLLKVYAHLQLKVYGR